MDLSILIVSFNTKEYLLKSLHSVFHSQTHHSFEVIVVDNNSQDGSVEEVHRHYPKAKTIKNLFNYGFATAMNQAYRASSGRYIMSFNPDAEVFPDTLEKAVEYMDANPQVGKIGLATVHRGEVMLPHSEFRRFEIPHLVRMFKKRQQVMPGKPYRVDWIFGTGLVIRRFVLPEGKLYDEDSFLFWEEYGLSNRIRKAGYEMHILPQVKILHHTSVTLKVPDKRRIYWARLLSIAHEWRVRKLHYGWVNAFGNALSGLADNSILCLLLTIKDFFSSKNVERNLELADRCARSKAFFGILFRGNRSVDSINREATLFFNNGVMPSYPPVTVTVDE